MTAQNDFLRRTTCRRRARTDRSRSAAEQDVYGDLFDGAVRPISRAVSASG